MQPPGSGHAKMGAGWSQADDDEASSQSQLQPGEAHRQDQPQNSKTKAKLLIVPHNFDAIVKDADSGIDRSSQKTLYDQLYAGVYLKQMRQKYWVDKKSNANCFMLFARNLAITWAEDTRYWHWQQMKATESDVIIEVAELLNVCWLEVCGNFEMEKLTPGTLYEIVLVMMLKEQAYGWETPLNLSLILPDGSKHQRQESLVTKARGQWIEMKLGELTPFPPPKNVGQIKFSMYECEGGQWKKGLVIKGVAIRPKN